ncbi:MAG: imidazole glycerol phosphate synthase subunit HisF [Anaerolineaceae bacterium]
MTVRIIPRLDIKGPNLVKGIHLEGLRVLGKPEDFARYYYENGADELIYMDAVASLYGRNSLLPIIEKTAKEIFIPLCVGGGIRSIDDVRGVLRAGADKVSINTAAIHRPEFIKEASRSFGSSTIVIGIEAFKHTDGKYEAYTNYGRDRSGIDAVQWALKAAELGAGEILITSINQEGTGKGFDADLVHQISKAVPIPVIAHGGAGQLSDIEKVITSGEADAVCIASILHYECLERISSWNVNDYTSEGNIEYLQRGMRPKAINPASLPEIKEYLQNLDINCRE